MFQFDEKKKKIFTVCSIIYALLILLVVVITNFDRFSTFYDWLNDKIAVLSPLFIGGIIAYLCTALVRFFQNRVYKKVKKNSLRRSLSIFSSYIFLFAVIILSLFLIVPQLLSSVEELVRKISDGTYLNSLINAINIFLNNILSSRGEEALEYINMESIIDALSELFAGTENILNQIIAWATTYGGKILTGLKNVFIGFLLSIYFVISKERLYAQSKRIMSAIFSKKRTDSVLDWVRFADKTFGGFIVGKLIDATLIIVVCSIVFSIANIPYSVLISVFIGICNIIPFFGPFIGAIPSGFIVFIAEPEKLLLFIVLIVIIQQIDGNIIEPKIVGDKTGLSSLGVLVAVTLMSGYFGILGMFLGVPIFAVICAIAKKNIDRRLTSKNLSTQLSDYYSPHSLVDPRQVPESFSSKFFRAGKSWIKKEENIMVRRAKKLFFKHKINKKETSEDSKETDITFDNVSENSES